ncbi:MAG: dephospho-CoA kinase, partial [Candidatus Dadabacteria bacterium]
MNTKLLNTPYLVAITGSIGSGKSTAAKFLKELGAEVIDADDLAREAVKPGSKALTKIKEVFGQEYLLENGELNRKKMASLIFSNKEAKEKLEAIVHPEVRRLYQRKLEELKNKQIIFYVIPLLFEVKNPPEEIRKIVVIAADKKLALERIA